MTKFVILYIEEPLNGNGNLWEVDVGRRCRMEECIFCNDNYYTKHVLLNLYVSYLFWWQKIVFAINLKLLLYVWNLEHAILTIKFSC